MPPPPTDRNESKPAPGKLPLAPRERLRNLDRSPSVETGRELKPPPPPKTRRIVIRSVVSGIELNPKMPRPAAGPPLVVVEKPSLAEQLRLRWREFSASGSTLLVVVVCAVLVQLNAVDTPFESDWDQVDLLEKLHAGTLTPADLHQAENGVRAPVPKAAGLFLARVSNGNFRGAAWLNFAVIAACAFGVFLMLVRTLGGGVKLWIAMLAANLILFSPLHFEQLLSGSELGALLAVASIIWGILFATAHLPAALRLPFCLICGVAGSFSHIAGLAIWPVVILLTLMTQKLGQRSGRIFFLIIWTLTGAAVFTGYFRGNAAQQLLTAGPEKTVVSWLVLVSETVAPAWEFAGNESALIIVGLTLLGALLAFAGYWLVATVRQKRMHLWNHCLPWFGLAFGALSGAGLICSSSENPTGAASAIFVAPVLLSLVVLYVILSTENREPAPEACPSRRARVVWMTLLSLFVLHQVALWIYGGLEMGRDRHKRLRAHAALLLSPKFEPRDLAPFATADPEVFQRRAKFLATTGYRQLCQNGNLDFFQLASRPLFKTEGEIVSTGFIGQSLLITVRATLPGWPRRGADALIAVRDGQIIAVGEPAGGDWTLRLEFDDLPAELWAIDASRPGAIQLPETLVVRDGAVAIVLVGE